MSDGVKACQPGADVAPGTIPADVYRTPLASLARGLEIFIPGYMFGKSWGIANEHSVELFRAEFPAFLIDMCEGIKALIGIEAGHLGRLVSTSAGALVGFAVIFILAAVMHVVMADRKYIDSVRFAAVTLIPLAVMNGTLSHVLQTTLENFTASSIESITASALNVPWQFFYMFSAFYLLGIWMLGRRTGVKFYRRWALVAVGAMFVAIYLASGLMIMPQEWETLLPHLVENLSHQGGV
jgi:hypothetical protein